MYAAVAAVIAAVVVRVDTAFIIATVAITTTPYLHTTSTSTSTSSGYVYTVITSITIIIHIANIIHTIMRTILTDFIIIIMIYTFRSFLTRGIEARLAVALVRFLRG
jgi:hypothetical protein